MANWVRRAAVPATSALMGAWPLTMIAAAALSFGVTPVAHADDLADVRATFAWEGKLFETHDVSLAARVFAPDVIWQNPFGVRFHGEAELEPHP